MPDTVSITIDEREIEVTEGKSVLEVALDTGIYIPHLCHHPDLPDIAECRLCVVEIDGCEDLQPSCMTRAAGGMRILTKSDRVDRMRKMALELLLAGHPADCGTCNKYLNCELQSLKQYLGIEQIGMGSRTKPFPLNKDNPLFVHDFSRCVLCGRCVRACRDLRDIGILYYKKRGEETYIGTKEDRPLSESGCRFCGACAEVCPTGAIMDKEELTRGKNRKRALVPCRYACPAEIDVPRYVRHIQKKEYTEAVAVIREKVPFPWVLGYVCSHPCETECRRGLVNNSISIRDLKRYAVERDERKLWGKNRNMRPATDKKVAVVGSGPAGLTAAYYLTLLGHEVTVFESMPETGGMMRYGIPAYRLPRKVLDSEIETIRSMGVTIETDHPVESVETLMEKGYDAVVVAIGAHRSLGSDIPGIEGEGVTGCVDFLRNVNLGRSVAAGKRVVVLGGGNAAFDSARVARRLGAEQVHLCCIESKAEMPASRDEIDQGAEEGIYIHPSRTATEIVRENGRVAAVTFLDVDSFRFEDDGTLQMETVEGSETRLDADVVILAVGQEPDVPESFGLDISDSNRIETDAYTSETSMEGVYAAGDAVAGGGALIGAIASGRKCAAAVDAYLGGNGLIDEKLAPATETGPTLGPDKDFAFKGRQEPACVTPEERVKSFCRVDQGLDEGSADSESGRCLQCDLRMKIATVKVWGSY